MRWSACLDLMRSDASRHHAGLTRWVLWSGPVARFQVLLRVGSFSLASRNRRLLRPLCRLFYRRHSHRYGLIIPYSTRIGRGLRLYHGHAGIVVNPNATIGDDCVLFHGVTIGGDAEGYPAIGHRVKVMAGL